MAFVEAPTLPTSVMWWVWKSRLGEELCGYFLGLIERPGENGKEKALAVYDEAKNIVWVGYLRGALWRVRWEDLLRHRVLIKYDGQVFQVKYDPDDVLQEEEIPAFSFQDKDKFKGFYFILPPKDSKQEPEAQKEALQEPVEKEINEEEIPF